MNDYVDGLISDSAVLAAAYLGCREDVEDVAQEAVTIFLRDSAVGPTQALSTIVNRLTKQTYRSNLNEVKMLEEYKEHIEDDSPPDEDAKDVLDRMLSVELVPREEQIVRRTYWYGQTQEVIALATDMRRPHVGAALGRALDKLRLALFAIGVDKSNYGAWYYGK